MAHEDKLIDHLSREIKTNTNNLMTFRSRVNLSVFLGPFVLLGSLLIATKGVPRVMAFDRLTVAAYVGLGISYFVMGWACARIEAHMWRQCNAWRRLIARVTSDSTTKISEADLTFDEIYTRTFLGRRVSSLKLGYLVVYLAMILAFVSAMRIVSQIHVDSAPNQAVDCGP